MTFTCNRVFVSCCIATFAQVKVLSTSSSSVFVYFCVFFTVLFTVLFLVFLPWLHGSAPRSGSLAARPGLSQPDPRPQWILQIIDLLFTSKTTESDRSWARYHTGTRFGGFLTPQRDAFINPKTKLSPGVDGFRPGPGPGAL